ncbi:MAG: hypothetical protein ACI9U0_002369, partial [Flavobacteriales bacterium]
MAKIVNGVKQPTVFCPFERLVSSIYHLIECLAPLIARGTRKKTAA